MKTINLKNYNNKLLGNVFIHIASAPSGPVMESSLPVRVKIVEEIETKSDSLSMLQQSTEKPISFEAEMIDFARCDLFQLGSCVTYPSHGMSREQFIEFYKNLNIGYNTGIYIYKKTTA